MSKANVVTFGSMNKGDKKEPAKTTGTPQKGGSSSSGTQGLAGGPGQTKLTKAQEMVSEYNSHYYAKAMADIDAGRTPGHDMGNVARSSHPRTGSPSKKPSTTTVKGAGMGKAPYLNGTTVRGTGPSGRKLEQPKMGPTVSAEKKFGKPGAKQGAKGRAAALEAAEARFAKAQAEKDAEG
eukprot:TRINITY_DN94016_c0_g1_i1.p1 TRINITY_DN94016_c0_g1~~TRINITY_DN94016_c0_g1_i1.p1  ORF type:complete len:190 (+),score=31.42 TRINITY_DN94016_c0_g1_i1:32-571(+)